jgi:hypothetical protein
MHVVGARFMSLDAAIAALRAIRASVAVEPVDVAVRPLGTTRYDRPIEAYLLAGRFREEDVDTVARIAEQHGGLVFSRRAELPRRTAEAPASRVRSAGRIGRAPRDRDARRACMARSAGGQ